MITLNAEARDSKIKPEVLRKNGKTPAVFYGRKQKSTPIAISATEYIKVWKKAGESTVVTLKLGDEELEALIYGIDKEPLTGAIRHADFYVFEKGQKMKIKIPIEFVGVAPAVKDMGGVLVRVLHELEIEAAPKDLPPVFSIDISSLVH